MQIFNYACLIAATTAVSLQAEVEGNFDIQYRRHGDPNMLRFKKTCAPMLVD